MIDQPSTYESKPFHLRTDDEYRRDNANRAGAELVISIALHAIFGVPIPASRYGIGYKFMIGKSDDFYLGAVPGSDYITFTLGTLSRVLCTMASHMELITLLVEIICDAVRSTRIERGLIGVYSAAFKRLYSCYMS